MGSTESKELRDPLVVYNFPNDRQKKRQSRSYPSSGGRRGTSKGGARRRCGASVARREVR